MIPVKVDPLVVATTESLMSSVTEPDVPPPVKPVPAAIAVISPTIPSLEIVIVPFEADKIEIPLPAIRNEVPSVSCVKEPLRP